MRRAALVALVAVAALACLALGWWQLQRYDAAGGTAQNLGYALQWPLFAAFVVYAYRRFTRLEQEHAAPGGPPPPPAPTELPEGLLPPRPAARVERGRDPELDAYNAHLAALAETSRAGTDGADHDRSTP